MFFSECWQFGSGIQHEGAGLLGLGLLPVELWVILPAQSKTMPQSIKTLPQSIMTMPLSNRTAP